MRMSSRAETNHDAYPQCQARKPCLQKVISRNSLLILLLGSSLEFKIYCHMTNDLAGCKGGGWTLVMKIDGDKVKQRKYNSRLVV